MTTFTWGRSGQAFVWGNWWDFDGLSTDFDVDGTTTSTQVELLNPVDNVRIVITGTGFSPTGPEETPVNGTITGFQVIEQDQIAVTLTDVSMTVAQFLLFLGNEDTNGFLNEVFKGADTLTGNALGDTLHGLGGGDTINGLNGADTLLGDAGNDTLIGGAKVDTLTGGTGKDNFVLNVAGAANRDNITDFSVPNDTIRLENSVFAGLGGNGVLANSKFYIGSAAHDLTDRIIYNATTGALYFDKDGNKAGGVGPVKIATLDDHLALTNADFVVI